MAISGQAIFDISNDVWVQMVGLELVPIAESDQSTHFMELLCCWVEFETDSFAGLLVTADPDLIWEVTSRIYRTDLDTVSWDMAHDTLGEIANIISGNIRAKFNINRSTATPLVGDEADLPATCFEASPHHDFSAKCLKRIVNVSLFLEEDAG